MQSNFAENENRKGNEKTCNAIKFCNEIFMWWIDLIDTVAGQKFIF